MKLSKKEVKIIEAIRKGEAEVTFVQKKRIPSFRIGDFDQYGCRVLSFCSDGSYLISSAYEPEEIEKAIREEGAKRFTA